LFFILPILAALVCCGINLAYAVSRQRRRAKKPIRLGTVAAALYFIGIYSWIFVDPTAYLVRSGILTRIGVAVLLVLLMADAIADWRINRG